MRSFPGKVLFPGFSGMRWYFSRESLSKDSFRFHAFGESFPGKMEFFPGRDFRVAAEGLFPGRGWFPGERGLFPGDVCGREYSFCVTFCYLFVLFIVWSLFVCGLHFTEL